MSCNSATATDSPPPVNKGHEANDLTVRKSPTDEIVVHTNDGSDDSDVEYFHDEVHDPILPHEEQITEPKDELNDRELNSTECLIQAVVRLPDNIMFKFSLLVNLELTSDKTSPLC